MAAKTKTKKPIVVEEPDFYCGICGSCGESGCCPEDGCYEIKFIKSKACLYPDRYFDDLVWSINYHTKVPKAYIEKVLRYIRDNELKAQKTNSDNVKTTQ